MYLFIYLKFIEYQTNTAGDLPTLNSRLKGSGFLFLSSTYFLSLNTGMAFGDAKSGLGITGEHWERRADGASPANMVKLLVQTTFFKRTCEFWVFALGSRFQSGSDQEGEEDIRKTLSKVYHMNILLIVVMSTGGICGTVVAC